MWQLCGSEITRASFRPPLSTDAWLRSSGPRPRPYIIRPWTITVGICIAHARSRTAAPSGKDFATGSLWVSNRLGARGAVSVVTASRRAFVACERKHEARPYEMCRGIGRCAQAIGSPPEAREARACLDSESLETTQTSRRQSDSASCGQCRKRPSSSSVVAMRACATL